MFALLVAKQHNRGKQKEKEEENFFRIVSTTGLYAVWLQENKMDFGTAFADQLLVST
jgi:hypothetical protein